MSGNALQRVEFLIQNVYKVTVYLSGSHSEEEFGYIRPSLIRQLRSILDQYADDGHMLKVCEDIDCCRIKTCT